MAQAAIDFQSPKALADQASSLRKAHEFAASIPLWQKLVASDPDSVVWKLRLAECTARAGANSEAEAAAASLGPECAAQPSMLIVAANALLNARCFAAAERLLEFLPEAQASNPDRLFLLGCVHQRTGRQSSALQLYRQSVANGDSRGRAAKALEAEAIREQARALTKTARKRVVADTVPSVSGDASSETSVAPLPTFDKLEAANAAAFDPQARAAARIMIKETNALIAGKDFHAARALLQRALSIEPRNADIRIVLATVFLATGNRAVAQAWLRGALALDPAHITARRDLARSLQSSELFEDALTHWSVFAKANPQNPEGFIQMARCYWRLRDFIRAAEAFQDASALAPDNEECLVGAARSLTRLNHAGASLAWLAVTRRNKNHVEALAAMSALAEKSNVNGQAGTLLDEQLADSKPTPETFLRVARSELAAGNSASAAAMLEQLLQAAPRSVPAATELARLHQARADWTASQIAWERLRRLQPLNLEALRSLSHALAKLGHNETAIDLWREHASAFPQAFEPHMRMARLHVQAHNRETAEICLRKAIELDPLRGALLGDLVNLLAADAQRRGEALQLTERWLQIEPYVATPRLRRSQLYLQLGQPELAEAELLKAQEIAPADATAPRANVQFLMRFNRMQEAQQPLRRWIELSSDAVEPHLILADLYVRLARHKEAEGVYQTLLARHPDSEQALNGIARICRSLRRIDEAIAIWRRAIVAKPSNVEAWTGIVASLANADRESEALDEFARAKVALGSRPEALAACAQMLDAGRFSKPALDAYLLAVEASPQDLRLRRRFGAFLRREGNMDGALVQLAIARDLDPGALDLALELIDVVEGMEYVGRDPWLLARRSSTGGDVMFPELLYTRLRQVAAQVECYAPVKGRVVLLNQSLAAGGAERQLVITLRGLASPEAGLESVSLFCTSLDPSTGRDFYLPHVLATGIAPVLPTEAGICLAQDDEAVRSYAPLLRHLPEDMAVVKFWLAEFRRRKPEVVHAWQDMTCLTAVVAALLAGVPKIILGARSVRPDNPRRRLRRWMRSAYADALCDPRVVMINNSQAGANDYSDWLDLKPDSIKVVHNGIDFDALAASVDRAEVVNIRAQLGIPAGAPVLGGVFRMSEEKRPLLFIETAAIVARLQRDLHVVVCGDGPMAREMRERASELGFADRLHLPGNKSDISNWLSLMDVVLLTSRHEGLPNVLIEAQGFGIPVVVPAVGGAPEVLDHGKTGFAVPQADAASLADRVNFCFANKAWYAKARKLAPRFVRAEFSISSMVAKTLEIYACGSNHRRVGSNPTAARAIARGKKPKGRTPRASG